MKTFKLISISVFDEGEVHNFPLIDGIIINQENSHRVWILEMFIDGKYKSFFETKINNEELLEAKAVISYPENEPAGFKVTVDKVKEIGEHVSVLMKGRIKRARSQYAEHLLEQLINEGLEGEALLKQFETDMRNRPRLKKDQKEDE